MYPLLILVLTLCDLSAVVLVHSLTAPYLQFMGNVLANHSYIDVSLVGQEIDGSDNVQCRTDLVTCCRASVGPHRGDWHVLGDSEGHLPFPTQVSGLFESRQQQRIDLRYAGGAIQSGIYHCSIETNAVNTGNREHLYLGVYSSGG